MTPSDKQLAEMCEQFRDILVQSGMARSAAYDSAAKKVRIDWTPDGLIFRKAVLNAHDSVAKWQGENSIRELCRMIAFVVEMR